MGNFLPCGGLSEDRHNSLSNRGRDGSCSGSNGGAIVPTGNFPLSENNGKYDSEALLGKSCGTNNVSSQSVLQWKRSENATYKDLRTRRPKIKAIVGLPKQSTTYDAVKWALDRLNIETVHCQTTESCINSCVVASLTTTPGNNLSSLTHNNATTNTSNYSNKREALCPSLVLLDLKATKDLDPEAVSRSIRNSNQGQHVVIIGIVKRSVLEKEEDTVTSYLQSGFNRILSENNNRGYWLNEMTQLISNEIDNAVRLRTLETLLTALDNCSDMVQITDHEDRIIFQNSVGERVLGYSSSDYSNGDRHLWDFQSTAAMYAHAVLEENDTACPDSTSGKELVQQKLNQGLIWEGHLSCKRKSGDLLPCESRIIPINFSCQKDPDQIVYVKKVPSSSAENTRTNSIIDSHLLNQKRRKSLKSFRNASLDIGSYLHPDGIIMNTARRQSNALSVGSTPLNKVITIILAAQKTSPAYVAQALDEVLEILQSTNSTDLFAPEMEEGQLKKTADPVTSDLLEALLSNSTRDVPSNNMTSQGRRQSAGRPSLNGVSQLPALQSSNNTTPKSSPYLSPVDARVDRSKPSQSPPSESSSTDQLHNLISVGNQSGISGVAEEARKAVEKCHMWDFDVIQLETITNHRCLVWLGMATFLRFELHKTLRCSETTLQNWLALIEANYHRSNSYHNSTHASDVLHATAFFLEQDKLKEICDDVDGVICLLAAAIHDVDHPGKNSAFLCNSNSELAKLYNDITVLENHHAALGFKLTCSDDRVNIFKNLDRDTYKVVRQGIIDLVLATDMSKHFIHLNKFATLYGRLQEDSTPDSADSPELPAGGPSAKDGDSQQIILADISSNPENMAIVKRMLIKCADVSNPARPLNICRQWAYRIAEEYFSQTEEEKRLGMPVVMPQFDRTTCSIPKSQIGFYNFFINDMFEMWNGFADLEMLSDIIKENYSYWELECQKEENGNAEEVTSSTNTTMDKKSTEEKKEATPSNENNTLTTTEGSSTSTSRKENEENGRPSEENKSA